jgi:hypothetical protein
MLQVDYIMPSVEMEGQIQVGEVEALFMQQVIQLQMLLIVEAVQVVRELSS